MISVQFHNNPEGALGVVSNKSTELYVQFKGKLSEGRQMLFRTKVIEAAAGLELASSHGTMTVVELAQEFGATNCWTGFEAVDT